MFPANRQNCNKYVTNWR